jgi:LPS sulfotransferase NodH
MEYGAQDDERTWRHIHGFNDHRNYFLHYAHRLCVSSNGVFGAKMTLGQMMSFAADLRRYKAIDAGGMIDAIDLAFAVPRYVQLLRKDKKRQAISLVRANPTGIWSSAHGPSAQPSYDPALPGRAGDFLLGQEDAWNDALRGLDQSRRTTLRFVLRELSRTRAEARIYKALRSRHVVADVLRPSARDIALWRQQKTKTPAEREVRPGVGNMALLSGSVTKAP